MTPLTRIRTPHGNFSWKWKLDRILTPRKDEKKYWWVRNSKNYYHNNKFFAQTNLNENNKYNKNILKSKIWQPSINLANSVILFSSLSLLISLFSYWELLRCQKVFHTNMDIVAKNEFLTHPKIFTILFEFFDFFVSFSFFVRNIFFSYSYLFHRRIKNVQHKTTRKQTIIIL